MANEARIEVRRIQGGNFRIRLYRSGIPVAAPGQPEDPLKEATLRAGEIASDSIRNVVSATAPALAKLTPEEAREWLGLLLKPIASEWEALCDRGSVQPLRTYFDLDVKLRGLPVETLPRFADEDVLDFYALDIHHSLLRFHAASVPAFTGQQVRILVVTGAGELEPGVSKVSSDEEVVAIQRSLQGCDCSVHLEILRLPNSEQVLTGEIEALQPHLVHFIGHGGLSPLTQQNALMFGGWAWDVNQISAYLNGTAWRPRLVFLNACFSAGGVESAMDVARALTRNGVPAVLGMQSAIRIPCAFAFTRRFYGALAEGCALDTAVHRGRLAITQSKDCGGVEFGQWALPVLSVAVPPQEVLPLPRYRADILGCHVRQELMVRNTFVNRFRERRTMVKSIAPYCTGEPFSRCVLLRGQDETGKTWLVQRCLIELAQIGYSVRYAELASAEPVSFIDVLDRLRNGFAKVRSPLFEPFPAATFEAFDRLFASVSARVRETGFISLKDSEIRELVEEFRSGLEAMANPNRRVVLALDRFSKEAQSSLRPADFNDILFPGLIEPVLNAAVSNVSYILVMRETELSPYGISAKLGRLRELNLGMFLEREARYLFDEYAHFVDDPRLEKLYTTFYDFYVKRMDWSPSSLIHMKPFVEKMVGR